MVRRIKMTCTIREDLDKELAEEARATNQSKSRHLENILLARRKRSLEIAEEEADKP